MKKGDLLYTSPAVGLGVKEVDFYINTPAVSISSNSDKFTTYENDGIFYILNSNTKTIYFNNSPSLLTERDSVREIGSTYLHLPLVLKFSTDRWNNVRPYVLAGVSYDHNFSSNQENSDDNFSGEFRMKTSNFMYEFGIGVDVYLSFFKFSPSIRGVFAMNRELIDDNNGNSPWTSPINIFSTRGVFLNFAFE